jgi:hypothetical protein
VRRGAARASGGGVRGDGGSNSHVLGQGFGTLEGSVGKDGWDGRGLIRLSTR